MIRVQLIATTQTPLMLGKSHEVSNLNASLDYITGTSLRGACAAKFLQHGYAIDEQGENQDAFYQLFCSEDVRFENLYPVYVYQSKGQLPDYYPSQPIPLSVRTCKGFGGFFDPDEDDQHGVTDTLCGLHKGQECPRCKSALDNFDGTFYYRDGGWYNLRKVNAQSLTTMHNEIEDCKQRSEEGILFTFEGIDRREVFMGDIYFMGENALELLTAFRKYMHIEGTEQQMEISVGKRRTGGRGKVIVQLSTFEDETFPNLSIIEQDFQQRFENHKAVMAEKCKAGGVSFTITLFSDAIVTDRWLRYQTALTEEVLVTELQLEELSDKFKLKSLFCAYRDVSGWNDAHKLPKADEVAILKGSSFLYRFTDDEQTLYQKLLKLEQQGIGFRRNEGFGRVIVNHPFHWGVRDIWR